ncbi:protein of unknown function [Streptantibioticus cattleyicolor NRRL 8057 = DSM 46488]|nr:protein of unknown function [Streptantibioticus cattleyicolor NRRL 8057 = DSM 46488]
MSRSTSWSFGRHTSVAECSDTVKTAGTGVRPTNLPDRSGCRRTAADSCLSSPSGSVIG